VEVLVGLGFGLKSAKVVPGCHKASPGGKEPYMISLTEQIVGAQREIALRRQCYPGLVKSGTPDPGDAKYQILYFLRYAS
jgi:hypothetical protein